MSTPKMQVEGQELLDRAEEVEAPIPYLPSESDNPVPPCELPMAKKAAQTLARNADTMRLFLAMGTTRLQTLAESLRAAARAYEEVDLEAAAAMSGRGRFVSGAALGRPDDGADELPLAGAQRADPTDDADFTDLKTAAWQIQQPDQGAAFLRFADAWETYQEQLLDNRIRFRPFNLWDGDAKEAAEVNFDAFQRWFFAMAQLCGTLAEQARTFVAAHKKAVPRRFDIATETRDKPWTGEHPTYYEVTEVERVYNENFNDPEIREAVYKVYLRLQQYSEEVLAGYARNARTPLADLSPSTPPKALEIKPPPDPGPDNPIIDVWDPENAPNVTGTDDIPDIPLEIPAEASPLDDSLPDPTGMPIVPPIGTPAMPDAGALGDPALAGATGLSTGAGVGAGVKPASFGGGGIGGVPSMPLAPPMDPDAAARAAAAAREAASMGRGLPGAGGAMGGGMGMPMAPGAAGQGQNSKGKHAKPDEESLYTEDRPWTEAVIGNRPRSKPSPDIKDLLK
ncbi:PPE domain-containing protein [Mycobacterium sp. Lab-001]|uniref:PPE domain-containing protein n=1 Tax=Mycobacterium sp. Lab-001 TaxID=3410136 RepID=UPI003D164C1D